MALTREEIAEEIKWLEKQHIEIGNGGNGGWLPTPPCSPLDFEPLKTTAIKLLGILLEQGDILPSDAEKIMESLAAKYEINYPNTAMEVYKLLNLYSLPMEEKAKLIRALSNDIQAEAQLLTTAT